MKSKKIALHQVDTFAAKNFEGCPVSLILGAERLSDEEVGKISRELGSLRQAYCYPSEKGDLRLRFFTGKGLEVKFCASGSLAALAVIGQKKLLGTKDGHCFPFDIETGAGVIPCHLDLKDQSHYAVTFDVPQIEFQYYDESYEAIAKALSLPIEIFDRELRPSFELSRHILILPVKNLESLASLEFDSKIAYPYARKNSLYLIAFVSLETIEKSHDAHVRAFSPLLDEEEDPFIGILHGVITAYLRHNKLVQAKPTYCTEQGHFLERPGLARSHLKGTNKAYSAQVIGTAIPLFETEIPILW